MKNTGMIRRLDKLGRVVIPIEIREKLEIIEGSPLEFFVDGNSIRLKLFKPNCVFCGGTNNLSEFKEKLICEKCRNNIRELNKE